MSINIRLAIPEDEKQCSELLDVLAEATSDPNNIFDSNTFNDVISNERGSLVIAEEEEKYLVWPLFLSILHLGITENIAN